MFEHIKPGDRVIYSEEGSSGLVEVLAIDHNEQQRKGSHTFTVIKLRALEDIVGGIFECIAKKGEEWSADWSNNPDWAGNRNWDLEEQR